MAQATLQGYADQIKGETDRIRAFIISKESELAAAATVEAVHAIMLPVLEPLKALGTTTDPVVIPPAPPVPGEPPIEPPVEPPVDPSARRR